MSTADEPWFPCCEHCGPRYADYGPRSADYGHAKPCDVCQVTDV